MAFLAEIGKHRRYRRGSVNKGADTVGEGQRSGTALCVRLGGNKKGMNSSSISSGRFVRKKLTEHSTATRNREAGSKGGSEKERQSAARPRVTSQLGKGGQRAINALKGTLPRLRIPA